MRRRRTGWLLTAILPCLVIAQSGYDAQPIGRPADVGPRSPPRPVPRGYQPPPSPLMFEAPRSRYNSANPQEGANQYRGYQSNPSDSYTAYQRPSSPVVVPHASARYVGSQMEFNRLQHQNLMLPAPPSPPPPPPSSSQTQPSAPVNYVEGWSEQQRMPPSMPFPHPSHPDRLIYTPEVALRPHGPPGILPQQEVPPAELQEGENPPDVLNNIIVHIYLNAKERQSHTTATSGPIRGVFGIGTSHGGPGSHTNPIVITKDFDRDTLEFIEEDKARQLVSEGPANIVEVKAMVSTPDRNIENTLNKAVNTELDRAIPMVMNRMQGPMPNMDDDLRKELEQALVDEIAKNLGETIDEIGSSPSDEDLGKLIEEGFNEISQEFSSTIATSAPTSATRQTTQPRTTTTIRTTTRVVTRPTITSPSTTTRETTTAAVDEMMKQSPFEQPPPPPPQETTTLRTPPPRTFRITTTTAQPVPPTATLPWWMTTRPTPTTTASTTTTTTARPTTATTPSTITTTRPTTTTTKTTTSATTTESTTQATEAPTRPTTTTRRATTTMPTTTTTEAPPTTWPSTTEAATLPTTWSSTTEATTTTRVFITTSTIPDRWKTTEVVFKKPEAEEKPATDFSSDQGTEIIEKPTTPSLPLPPAVKPTEEMELHHEIQPTTPEEPKWTGQVEPAKKVEEQKEEEEPKPFVTSRPIHIVSLEESAETTRSTTTRGTTMGVRVTQTPPLTTTEAPLTSIFDESAFGTVTVIIPVITETSTTVVQPAITTPQSTTQAPFTVVVPTIPIFAESSTISITATESSSTAQGETASEPAVSETSSASTAATFPTLPEETEEPMEPEEGVVMKGRPTNFGDQNMMKAEIEKEMLEEGVTEQSTTVTVQTTEARPPGIVPSETAPTTSEEVSTTTTTSTAAETEQAEWSTVATSTEPVTSATEVIASSTTIEFETSEASTIVPSSSSTSSSAEVSSASTEPPPFEAQPGMFEPAAPTVAQRQPLTEETPTSAEEAATTFQPSTEEVQPVTETIAMPKGPCPTPNDESDTNRSDVLFLLDSSNSFTEQKFMHAIQLILDTVAQFRNIGPNGTQVSLVQYNSEPYLEFSLRKHNCKQWLIDDIADTDYMQGGNMLGKAVEKVTRFAFTKNRGDRPDAENILVVLTDGQSNDRIQEPVEIAKKNNLTVLVIATLEANPKYIMELAGNMDNVFRFHTDPHKSLPLKLAERINSLGAATALPPVSTPETTTVPPTSTTIRILEPHEMFTIALPEEEEEVVTQAIEHREPQTTVPVVPTVATTPWMGSEPQGVVHLECTHLGFKINLNVPGGYDGTALVKGQEDKEECRKEIRVPPGASNSSVGFFVASNACGVTRVKSVEPAGQNYSLILHLVHHGALVTGGDRAYLLQCFIGKPTEDTELSADLTVMKGELMIAETISLSSVPPTCAYSIRKDSPDGPVVTNAFVGQTVYHRWDCDGGEEANSVYGMQIHSCYASDDVDMKFPIVDNRGCSSDLALLSDPKYYEDRLTAYAESKAFAFQQAESLKFVCKLSLCTRDGDGCEGVTPPACSGNSPDLLVTRRLRQNTALEGALSSALSTRVDMFGGQPTMTNRVAEVLSSKGSLILLAALVVVALIGTVLLTRYARRPVDATTNCSDPETFLSSPTSPVPPPETPSPQPPLPTAITVQPSQGEINRQLAEFMKDFDRSRYV